jgi:hypothetical protein
LNIIGTSYDLQSSDLKEEDGGMFEIGAVTEFEMNQTMNI